MHKQENKKMQNLRRIGSKNTCSNYWRRVQEETDRAVRRMTLGVLNSLTQISGTSVLCLIAGLLMGTPLLAQNGTIQGTVVDQQGAVIPNATIKATDQLKGVLVRQVQSNATGDFQLQPLGASTYTLEISAPGMSTVKRPGVVLELSQTLNLGQIPVSVGSESTVITVNETPILIQTTNSEHSDVITSKEVTEQSTNGRDFTSLVRTLPGIVSNNASDFNLGFNSTTGFFVNGFRSSANQVYLDGAINTDVGANDGEYTQLSFDAVGEFRVLSGNYNAEYGRSPGVNIQINTKNGGQQFHGTLYEFARNDFFDANSYGFNHSGTKIAKLRFNQFGGNIGGPILIPKYSVGDHKKLFFFYNYEETRGEKPNGNSQYQVPVQAQLTGDFSSLYKPGHISTAPQFQIGQIFMPGTITRDSGGNITGGTPYAGNIVPSSQFSKQTAAFQKLLNTAYTFGPNSAVANDPSQTQVSFQDTYTLKKTQNVLRIDYNLNDKVNMFFRWVDDGNHEEQGLGIFSSNAFPILPEYRGKPGSSWEFALNNIITPSLTNEAIFQFNHLTQIVDVNTAKQNYDEGALGFTFQQLYPATNLRNTYPNFNANGFNISNFSPGWASEARTLGFTDTLTKLLGQHTLKAGGFVNLVKSGQQPGLGAASFDFTTGQSNAQDTGNGVANLLLGNYASVNQGNGIYYGSFKFHQWEIFAQDTWRINKRLTLDYGLRYAYLGPTYTYGKFLQYYFDPARYNQADKVSINTMPGVTQGSILPGGNPYNGMVQEGTEGIPAGFSDHRYNNFQPRVGFALDVYGDGKTALRGGFGMFNERVRQNTTNFGGLGNPPLSYTPTIFNGNIDNLSPGLVANSAIFPSSIVAFDKKGDIPTYFGYSLGVQQQLSHDVIFSATYVGNVGRHESYSFNLNTLPLGSTTTPIDNTGQTILSRANNVVNAIVPYRGYGSATYTKFDASSNYNSLQASLQRRFSRSLTISANYVWSKTIDLADDDNVTSEISDAYNPQRDRAVAGWDRRNVFNVNYVYTAPEFLNHGFLFRSAVGGWELTGISRFWSGLPFSVFSNGNPGTLGPGQLNTATSGNSAVYANYNGASAGQLYTKTYTQWFNPLLFSRPLDGSLGNTHRNQFRGPGIAQWNISLFKNIVIKDSMRIQLRLETFNTFNHTQFATVYNTINVPDGPGLPVTSSNRSNAGAVQNTLDPREIQLGGKFYF
jgi:hypothetical protein